MGAAPQASCGTAYCSIHTDWDAQSPWRENATLLDLRMEYIQQDQLRAGREKTVASGVVDEHDEIETRNRNFVATHEPCIQRLHDRELACARRGARSLAHS
jgi:hypothetical protein